MAAAETAAPSLRERLVEEALAILDEEGIAGLSLRRIAQRAGVSHGAPARHFAGLSDLLAEVAARGFEILRDATRPDPTEPDPLTRMRTVGRGYVEAATTHPELFALMFRPQDLDFANPSLARASSEAFEQLVQTVTDAQARGLAPERDTRVLAGSVWAAVHGLASLWSQGALQSAMQRERLDDSLDTTMSLLLDSIQAPGGS